MAWKEDAQKMAAGIRRRVLEHTKAFNGGYLSQACSSAEIFAALYARVLKLAPLEKPLLPRPFDKTPGPDHPALTGENFNGAGKADRDSFILSPAQYALVLYAALVEAGRMDEKGMETYNKDGSTVEMIGAEHSPGMEVTTGSLGQGISQAAGIALARRIRGESGRAVLFMSDGECESGQFWEAVQAASYHKLGNMLVYVDMNGFQCDGKRDSVMEIEPFDKRLESFGARVFRIDGHNLDELVRHGELPSAETPTFILCDTDPARDMDLIKDRYPKFHYIRFNPPGGQAPAEERNGFEIRSKVHAKNLVAWGKDHPDVYVLSADLTGSCEADTFRDTYPERFLSMGIAEQNMLSFAGGMARKGLVPMPHTFAVFIYRRAYDQISMSIAYPNLPVKMFGFLPGVLTPGGATHQAIEDVALMRALPNMTIYEPGDAAEVEAVLDIAYKTPGPVYVRQLRGEVPVLFPADEPMTPGKCRKLSSGSDIVLITSGICTEEGLRSAFALRDKGLSPSHYHVSTLKPFHHPEIIEEIAASRYGAVTLENHSVVGGLGSIIAEAMAEAGTARPLRRLGIPDTFVHGASRRYLMKEYGLDAMALIAAVETLSGQRFGIAEEDLARSFTPAVLSAAKAEAL